MKNVFCVGILANWAHICEYTDSIIVFALYTWIERWYIYRYNDILMYIVHIHRHIEYIQIDQAAVLQI